VDAGDLVSWSRFFRPIPAPVLPDAWRRWWLRRNPRPTRYVRCVGEVIRGISEGSGHDTTACAAEQGQSQGRLDGDADTSHPRPPDRLSAPLVPLGQRPHLHVRDRDHPGHQDWSPPSAQSALNSLAVSDDLVQAPVVSPYRPRRRHRAGSDHGRLRTRQILLAPPVANPDGCVSGLRLSRLWLRRAWPHHRWRLRRRGCRGRLRADPVVAAGHRDVGGDLLGVLQDRHAATDLTRQLGLTDD
jgi:hypothetical protein